MPKFYILAGKWSQARAQRVGDDVWSLTGHMAGEQIVGVEYRGPDADGRCFHDAKLLAFSDTAPTPRIRRETCRGLQPVIVMRKAV